VCGARAVYVRTNTELTAVLDDLFVDFLVPVLVTRFFSRAANSGAGFRYRLLGFMCCG